MIGLVSTACSAQAIPDCYAPKELVSLRPKATVSAVVLLDETTVFAEDIKPVIQAHVKNFVSPGLELLIYKFSAYVNGKYTSPVLAATFARPFTEKESYDVRKSSAKGFERCIEIQKIRAEVAIEAALRSFFSQATSDIPRSEIVAAMKDIGDNVLPRLTGQRKVVLLVSDMLENSQLSSFYSKGGVRKIDAQAELSKVNAKTLTTDLRRADVYVFGAGLLPSDVKQGAPTYRDQATMGALREFWKGHIEMSHGTLKEFGQPLLLSAIRLQ
jgi:hypothetical protein